MDDLLYRVVGEGLSERVIFDQRSEVREEEFCGNLREEYSRQAQRN